jgi:hypothetical protein
VTCAIQGSLVCPTGYKLSDNSCISITDNCGAGYYWNGLMCCGIQSIITCAQGFTYDGQNCVYTSKGGSTYNCNNGFVWNGVSCVPGTGSSCDSGFYWNGLRCILLTSQTGSLNGNPGASSYPICSSGSYWHPASSMCISGSITSGAHMCSSGTIWNGVGCSIAGGYNQCNSGSYWTGSSCARM